MTITNNSQDAPHEPNNAMPVRVAVGMRVTIEVRDPSGKSEIMEFDLVPDKVSDFSAGRMSEQAPLARSILGCAVGDNVVFSPPSGDKVNLTVTAIRPSQGGQEQQAPDRRDVLGNVMDRIVRRESRQIALTAELHYGSIDADGIDEE